MTNEREVVALVDGTGNVSLDLDPIMVTIVEDIPAIEFRVADGGDPRLADVWEAVEEASQDAADALAYTLVWSDTRRVVKATCVACGGPFDVNEMMVSDGGMVCIPCFEDED